MTTAFLSLPLWMQFLAGFILLGLGLMFILMPFSIFGVKPRLEEVELQLNEVRAELRIIAMRLAQGGSDTGPSGEPIYAPPRRNTAQSDPAPRPPEVAPTARCLARPNPCRGPRRLSVLRRNVQLPSVRKARIRHHCQKPLMSSASLLSKSAVSVQHRCLRLVTITAMLSPALRRVFITSCGQRILTRPLCASRPDRPLRPRGRTQLSSLQRRFIQRHPSQLRPSLMPMRRGA